MVPVVSVLLWTTTIAALLAPSQGIFKAVVRAYYEVYKRINAGDVDENVAFLLFFGWLKSDDYTSLLLGENLLS